MFMGNDGLTSYLNVLGGLGIRDQIELAQNAGRWFSKVEDRLKGIGHIAQSVGNMLTGNSNSSDVSVLSNLRSFPVFKPLIDLSQRLGIGDTGDDIRSVM